jgi:RHS repeat-associated protein
MAKRHTFWRELSVDAGGMWVGHARRPGTGGVRVTTGAPIDLRFPGQWFQTEAGLHQNWLRDYDPTTGRYMQADPLELVDGASVYGYARQSPMRNVDPNGLDSAPNFKDQWNLFGWNDGDTNRNFTDHFNTRFPNSVAGALRLLDERIRKAICLNRLLPKLPGIVDDRDIDILPNMNRFGDVPQGWWERKFQLGKFEFRTDDIDVDWTTCPECYSYRTETYVSENAGQDYMLGLFRERRMRYAEWPMSGSGCCDF